jgi:signal transduction histidine kinase
MEFPRAAPWRALRSRSDLTLLTLVLVVSTAFALRDAVSWHGRAVSGFWVDAGGLVSSYGMSTIPSAPGIGFPDRVVAQNGQRVETGPWGAEARSWDQLAQAALEAGATTVEITARRPDGTMTTAEAPLTVFAGRLWWSVAGAPIFLGIVWLAAGLVGAAAAPRSKLAHTTSKLAIIFGTFFVTLFDHHTTRHQTPLFLLTYGMAPPIWLTLALRLPSDASILVRFPWLERALDGVGLSVGVLLCAGFATGTSTAALQTVWSFVFGGALLLSALVFSWRLVRSKGADRRTMRILALAMVPVNAVAGWVVLYPNSPIAAIIPPATLAPIAVLYVLVRYDLYGSRARLARPLVHVVVGLLACSFVFAVTVLLAQSLAIPFHVAFVTSFIAVLGTALLLVVALSVADRLLFVSRYQYRPTVAQLSAKLATLTTGEEVADAVASAVRQCVQSKQVTLADQPLPGSGPGERAHHGSTSLRLPLAFGHKRARTLEVHRDHSGPPFSAEDIHLIQTICDQATLAFAHADAYAELELRRQQQMSAWTGERRALVETVAAEVAHEVRYSINYFRSLFDQASRTPTLAEEDIEVGGEEVERLERLLGSLRRISPGSLQLRTVAVAALCVRAELLLRDLLGARRIEYDVPPGARARCDPDKTLQVLVNLLGNALDACGPHGALGVRFHTHGSGAELAVWDTGPGFEDPPETIFSPWYSTKSHGTGLGLAIVHRIIRVHRWRIQAQVLDAKTVFTVHIPLEDVEHASDRPDPEEALVAHSHPG